MVDAQRVETLPTDSLSPAVLAALRPLCEGDCHTVGGVLGWSAARAACCQAVICPECATQFVVDDDELAELLRWTDDQGKALVCGVRWD